MVDLSLEARFEAIHQLADGVGFTISGGNIIEWDKGEKPTEEEIQSKIDSLNYARNRATEYPALAEQLDLLYHDMTAGKGTKSGNWYKAVNKVKTDNPKPE